MRVERYVREYPYDKVDGNYGFYLSNDSYPHGGDAEFPGFKILEEDESSVDRILKMAEIESGLWGENTPEYQYVVHGLRQLILGQKSDWKITQLEPQPGRLRFCLRNRKIIKARSLLMRLDTGDESDSRQTATLELSNDDLGAWVIVELVPQGKESCSLKFSNKRKDAKKETDFYTVHIRENYANVKGHHRVSLARFNIELEFSEETDSDIPKSMVAYIEEVY